MPGAARTTLVAILGGAKVSDKIGVLRRFMQLADTLLVGGGMANTLLAAKGYDLGDSFYEAEASTRKTLLEESGQRCRLELPVDLLITPGTEANASYQVVSPTRSRRLEGRGYRAGNGERV